MTEWKYYSLHTINKVIYPLSLKHVMESASTATESENIH